MCWDREFSDRLSQRKSDRTNVETRSGDLVDARKPAGPEIHRPSEADHPYIRGRRDTQISEVGPYKDFPTGSILVHVNGLGMRYQCHASFAHIATQRGCELRRGALPVHGIATQPGADVMDSLVAQ